MFEATARVCEAVRSGFSQARVLVVGDLMLDRYLRGRVERISPEAPVPVLRFQARTESPGGAANVARNLLGLGLTVDLLGILGRDADGDALIRCLQREGIGTQDLVSVADRPTTCKTRVIGDHQQMLRIDEETRAPCAPEVLERLQARALDRLGDARALVLSDYDKGTLSAPLCRRLIREARDRGIPVLVDPKGQDFSKYRGARVLTPNRAEIARVLHRPPEALSALLAQADGMRRGLDLHELVITLGELGCALLDDGGIHRVPAVAREVFDVSGAGDTVIATLAAGETAGLGARDRVRLANVAAGLVIGKMGTAAITRSALIAAIEGETPRAPREPDRKLVDRTQAKALVDAWKAAGERIVFTNGCFDLLHVGHVSYLDQARRYGDRLVVGLNTDASVRALKGPDRPILGQEDRARILAALAAVDLVIFFEEPTPWALIQMLRPQVLAKGADYREEEVVGAEAVRAWGGRVVLIPLVENRSTTHLLRQITSR